MLGYDALRQLISWQNQATSPTQTASYAYNGSGERVQQSVTSGGTTTTTSYIGAYEEVSVTGGTTTTTKYYSAGLATVVNVNGTLSYLVGDTLGSVSASLTAAGGTQATELYTPYGSVRYSSGTMPTSYGYTKQRQDPSGLNYDHARYYDASVGQFISADSVQGPNRYGYVAGNPETTTDPTGNLIADQGNNDGYCATCRQPTGSGGEESGVRDGGVIPIRYNPPTQPTTSHPTHSGGGGSGGGTSTGGGGGTGGGDPTQSGSSNNNPLFSMKSDNISGSPIFVDNNILAFAFDDQFSIYYALLRSRIVLLIPEVVAEFLIKDNGGDRFNFLIDLFSQGNIIQFDSATVRGSKAYLKAFGLLASQFGGTDAALAGFARATKFQLFTTDKSLYTRITKPDLRVPSVLLPVPPPPSPVNSGGDCNPIASIFCSMPLCIFRACNPDVPGGGELPEPIEPEPIFPGF